ncbi:Ras-like GTPase superfamily protein [Naegleria gruberi]|uniref:Ras-like GTPase superfamily protein n=1 Tax=Naegleria gruberi TaxID=5762 RepID=D2VR59_NAEGR|nr:Ras-like GTPase superfamily protein [Naegleria gruberi]EFC40839.1 Ras-like GTPase superfamily protein [Naegleria gruberi]|eukprot:XP_002673583.1 Ras-like GTPase superfamily protein [Naegleria gruberi strain NEG-M]
MIKLLLGPFSCILETLRSFSSTPIGENSQIIQIPNEILCEIFEYISGSWFSLLRVCKSFRKVVIELIYRKGIIFNNSMMMDLFMMENIRIDENLILDRKILKRYFKTHVYEAACCLINDNRTVRSPMSVVFDPDLWQKQVQQLKNSCTCFHEYQAKQPKEKKKHYSYIAGDFNVGRSTFCETVVYNKAKYKIHRNWTEYLKVDYKIGENNSYEHGLFFPSVPSLTLASRQSRTIPIIFAIDNEKSFTTAKTMYESLKSMYKERDQIAEFVLIGNKAERTKRVISKQVAEKFAYETMDSSLYFEQQFNDSEQAHKIMLYMFLMGQIILPLLDIKEYY